MNHTRAHVCVCVVGFTALIFLCLSQFNNYREGSPLGIVANVLDCDIVVSEFEIQLRDYFYFRTNTLRKCINSFSLPTPSYWLNCIPIVLLQGWF